jgi:uncharacterized protein YkwD
VRSPPPAILNVVRFVAILPLMLASAGLACGAGVYPTSNSAKLGEALAFAAVAGAAQIAQSAAERHARNSAPVTHSSTGVNVSPVCDNDDQYGCVSVSAAPSAGDAPEPEMSDSEARDYVLGYVNGVRKLNEAGPLVRDETLDAFAQAGSDELALDHRPNQHMVQHSGELRASSTEVQGSPDGTAPGGLQDQIAGVLVRSMGEGPGGIHHDAMLRREWRKLGVGIARREGRTYVTVDFSN